LAGILEALRLAYAVRIAHALTSSRNRRERRMDFKQLALSTIRPNPANPRHINIPEEDEKLGALKDSIARFGVMVPIVVSPRDNHFILLDGERRYWAAKALSLPRIPAYILEGGTELGNDELLLRMFQIHHNHEQWKPIAQCRALEPVYDEIAKLPAIRRIRDEPTRLKAVAEELVKRTGIEERTALNRIHFLRWPKEVRSRLYDSSDEPYWYICEIEEKIIIPAMTNYPEYFDTVPADEVRVCLLQKLDAHAVERSTEVRRVAPFLRKRLPAEKDRKRLLKVLDQLRSKREMTYADAQTDLAKEFPHMLRREPVSPRRLANLAHAFQMAIEDFDLASIDTAQRRNKPTRQELTKSLRSLLTSVEEFLDQIGGRG
jgi:hypothetical protein